MPPPPVSQGCQEDQREITWENFQINVVYPNNKIITPCDQHLTKCHLFHENVGFSSIQYSVLPLKSHGILFMPPFWHLPNSVLLYHYLYPYLGQPEGRIHACTIFISSILVPCLRKTSHFKINCNNYPTSLLSKQFITVDLYIVGTYSTNVFSIFIYVYNFSFNILFLGLLSYSLHTVKFTLFSVHFCKF